MGGGPGVDLGRIAATLLAWVPAVVVLFRVFGPRRATLLAVVVGNLFLPGMGDVPAFGLNLRLDRQYVIGAGLAAGVLLFDRRALARARPHWFDLFTVVYALYPLTGFATGGAPVYRDAVVLTLDRVLGYLIPYAAARLYLGSGDGAKGVAVTLVVVTLVYTPLHFFEAAMGPKWYVAKLLFRHQTYETITDRMGAYRPDGLLMYGIMVATWLALAAVAALWLWAGRVWKPARGPSGWPVLVLLAATAASRGVYGYVNLALGVAAVVLTQTLRTRAALLALALLAPAYVSLRASGLWDGRSLERGARFTGRSGTVGTRIDSEDFLLNEVLSKHPAFGFGNSVWNARDVGVVRPAWLDGLWTFVLWSGGLVGLALHFGVCHLLPSCLALARPRGRPVASEAASPAWCLALLTSLLAADSLQNSPHHVTSLTALIAGSLVGIALAPPRPSRPGAREAGARAGGGPRPRRVEPLPRPVALTAGLACVLYVFAHGRLPGYEAAELVGGLGASLLFAAAGWAGAWASGRFPLDRVAACAGLFALFGVSFNLALYPTRSVWAGDLLQGMAMSGFAVAAFRRAAGDRPWAYALLAAIPLVTHLVLRPWLPTFPGSQFLLAGPSVALSLHPLCPDLTFAALAAWGRRETPAVNLAAAGFFAVASAAAWGLDPSGGWPVKIPMNVSYAALGCAAVGASLAAVGWLESRENLARPLGWLGRNWLTFFYLHFAFADALTRAPVRNPLAVWGLLAATSAGATWLVSALAPRASGLFRSPVAWGVLLAVIVAAAAWPGLPADAVRGVAGTAGLVFAAGSGAVAPRVLGGRRAGGGVSSSSSSPNDRPAAVGPDRGRGRGRADPWRGLAGLAVVLAAMATPELLGWVTGEGPSRRYHTPPRPRAAAGKAARPKPGPPGPDDDLMRRLKEWERAQSKPAAGPR